MQVVAELSNKVGYKHNWGAQKFLGTAVTLSLIYTHVPRSLTQKLREM